MRITDDLPSILVAMGSYLLAMVILTLILEQYPRIYLSDRVEHKHIHSTLWMADPSSSCPQFKRGVCP